jgi:hypothetical protein
LKGKNHDEQSKTSMGNVQAAPVEDAALKEAVGLEFSRGGNVGGGGGGSPTGVVRTLEGSGRFIKSFRVTHDQTVPIVVKAVQLRIGTNSSSTTTSTTTSTTSTNSITNDNENDKSDWCKEQVAELKRIRAIPSLRHTAKYTQFWIAANNPPLIGLAVREYIYTTLADRLSCRPWLTMVEKLYVTRRLFAAVVELHDHRIYWHGGLSVYNVGLTSLHTVKLLDIGISRPTGPLSGAMFHAWYKQHRCTVPPERFAASSSSSSSSSNASTSLTTASSSNNSNNNNHHNKKMYAAEDCFSVACIITELFTGSSWDLGEILANELPINNIALPAVRACCKHMLSIDRLDDMQAYHERLVSTTQIETFTPVLTLTRRMEDQVCPDARLALLVEDPYFCSKTNQTDKVVINNNNNNQGIEEEDALSALEDLSKSVETALKDLENDANVTSNNNNNNKDDEDSGIAAGLYNNPHILYIHLVLATVRHVQRPSSKVRGLKLLLFLQGNSRRHNSRETTTDDETRLQRIVPVTVQLLQDADAAVRATALYTLTEVVAQCTTFPPSDAQLFPQVRVF